MNFLIVAVDSLRADRMCDPDALARLPNFSKFIRDSTNFTQAITAAPVTTPSFASLLTARFSPMHGIRSLKDCKLADGCLSLPELFARAGYYTFAEVTGPLLECTGLNRGFMHYHCRNQNVHLDNPWGMNLIETLRKRNRPEPWFGLVHLWGIHYPYHVSATHDHPRYGHYRYDRALAQMDAWIGRLLETNSEDTVVVLLGDHGESLTLRSDLRFLRRMANKLHYRLGYLWDKALLGDRSELFPSHDRRLKARLGRFLSRLLASLCTNPSLPAYYRRWDSGHGPHLYDEVIRIPLAFAGGPFTSRSVPSQVRSVDILPTLLDLAGLELPATHPPLDGHSLLPLLEGEQFEQTPAFFATGVGDFLPEAMWFCGLRTPELKYWYCPAQTRKDAEELFDLRTDPGEKRNIAASAPETAARLRAQCEAVINRPVLSHTADTGLSADEQFMVLERLRELGYVS